MADKGEKVVPRIVEAVGRAGLYPDGVSARDIERVMGDAVTKLYADAKKAWGDGNIPEKEKDRIRAMTTDENIVKAKLAARAKVRRVNK